MDMEEKPMSYITKDEQLLIKIEKYIRRLDQLLKVIAPLTDDAIDDTIEAMALTQCVTNLFELTSRIEDDDIIDQISILRSAKVGRLKNIASHDYDAVNWSIVKTTCRKILDTVTPALIHEILEDIATAKAETKCYRKD